ncbi:MAG TPA: hypothetical protein PK317_00040 [Coprothermobacter proteolyticus]|nr:hypothetical protein [Coprothermobacter proteolyticus]
MIFVPDSTIEIEIEGAIFNVRLLSGEEMLKLVGKKGLESLKTLDIDTMAEIARQSVVSFAYEDQKYGPEAIKKLSTNVYLELLQKVFSLNFEVNPENFPMMKDLST